MTKRNKIKSKQSNKSLNVLILLIMISVFIYQYYKTDITSAFKEYQDTVNTKVNINNNSSNTDELKVSFLDVGQADSILIQESNHNMLIDAGNNEDGENLVKYFKEEKIQSFDYVIATHPHEDHIGGMDNIINNFNIGKFMMPNCMTTTSTFEDVLNALSNKNQKYYVPKENDIYKLKDATIKIIYVGKCEKNLNKSSIIVKLTYKGKSFLFTGDAPSEIEKKILNKDIQADVLKVGHHGSQYSSSSNFLYKVNPSYAVIEVGKDNLYDHPKQETLDRLNKVGAVIYRTDKDGTIVAKTDGSDIIFTKKGTKIDENK